MYCIDLYCINLCRKISRHRAKSSLLTFACPWPNHMLFYLCSPFCTFLHLSAPFSTSICFLLFSPLTVDNVEMSERHLLSQVQARRASSRALALARETCDSKLEASAARMAEDGRDLHLAGRDSKS
jgi:hypothetical protein